MGDGSSSDGEGWLQRIEADQVSDAQEDRIADVRDSIRLTPDDHYAYSSTSDSLIVTVRCSTLAVRQCIAGLSVGIYR